MRDVNISPRTGFGYLDEVLLQPGSVLALAHRGGAAHPDLVGLENTLRAFEHAVALGYRYLETDVHATRDGVLLAFHDALLDRVTDRVGAIADHDYAEIRDARVGAATAGQVIPLLADLLVAFPQCRFNIDIKSDTAVEPLVRLIEATGADDRFLVGSFSTDRLNRFRRLCRGQVATSASRAEVSTFLTAPSGRLARRLTRGRVAALQVPYRYHRIPVVTASLVRRAHAAGAHVHVWTIDEPAQMHHLLDIGVDGIFTDRTDLLKDVLQQRGLWRSP